MRNPNDILVKRVHYQQTRPPHQKLDPQAVTGAIVGVVPCFIASAEEIGPGLQEIFSNTEYAIAVLANFAHGIQAEVDQQKGRLPEFAGKRYEIDRIAEYLEKIYAWLESQEWWLNAEEYRRQSISNIVGRMFNTSADGWEYVHTQTIQATNFLIDLGAVLEKGPTQLHATATPVQVALRKAKQSVPDNYPHPITNNEGEQHIIWITALACTKYWLELIYHLLATSEQ